MERPSSPRSDPETVSPKQSPPSDHRHHHQDTRQFAADFTALYHSLFPPKSPSISLTPSTASPSFSATAPPTADDFATTEHGIQQDYQQLCDHYDFCVYRLQSLSDEIEALLQENNELRLINNESIKLIGIYSQNFVEPNLFDTLNNNNNNNVTLPKSISVRSSGYHKINSAGASSSARRRVIGTRHLISKPVQQRVCVPAGGNEKEDVAVELDVYNQGMWKTELCNKWQETGTCPYGDNCQFAHGLTELRPVIRHPRYKTQVCRMVVAGDVCPYGHRCHFRHSLTEQERPVIGP